MPLPVRVIRLRRGDRTRLQRLTRARTTPQRVVERARIVLASAAGDSGHTICAKVGVSRPTVTLWLDRYEAKGLAGLLSDRPRSGRPKRLTPADEAAIVHRTLHTAPPAGCGTHWSNGLFHCGSTWQTKRCARVRFRSGAGASRPRRRVKMVR